MHNRSVGGEEFQRAGTEKMHSEALRAASFSLNTFSKRSYTHD